MEEKEFEIKKEGKGRVLGKSVDRTDAKRKVRGKAIYGYDYGTIAKKKFDDLLYTEILKSSKAHAKIKNIDTSEAEKVDGVVKIFTHEDVPDVKFTTAGQAYPEPSPYDTKVLNEKVRFMGEPVAIVAAESESAAREASNKIEVEYEELPVILDPEKSLESDVKIHEDGNLTEEIDVEVGDPEEGFEESDVIIEENYSTPIQKHIHLEPHACVAHVDNNGRLIVETTNQVVYHIRRILSRIFDKKERDVRVKSWELGGGFGDKQEMIDEHYASLVALATGRPTLVQFTRIEQFLLSRRRHAAKLNIKIGSDKEGNVKALHLDAVSDTGGYGTHGMTVTANMGTMTLPLYTKNSENLKFTARVAYTNKPPAGAYRGYGTIQGGFALECAMDELAEELDMDPIELRVKNAIEEGDVDPFSKVLSEGGKIIPRKIMSCGLTETLEEGGKIFNWSEKKEQKKSSGKKKRGIGIASAMKGSGVPGFELSSAIIKLNEDGSIFVSIGGSDLGQGLESVVSQIAAETVGVELEDVRVVLADTDNTPHSMGVYASSGTYMEGNAVRKAGEELREKIIERAAEMMDKEKQDLGAGNGEVYVKENPNEKISIEEIAMDTIYGETSKTQLIGFGDAECFASPPPFTTHFVEVEIDEETYDLNITKYLNLTDVGTAINPREVEGQIEGSIVQGLGFSIFEEMKFSEDGKLLNPTLGTYTIPTSLDAPEIETKLVKTHEPTGPFGAKSVGEVCIVPPAPVVANAIYDAIGVRITDLPITKEKIKNAIESKK
ncbi:MAG: molybdopterin-dependent oxidoreductase [Hadesarchaea archaeon]|nr:molybdopterin-dependent oxidoreductase [Hadesarchaea archaeon]